MTKVPRLSAAKTSASADAPAPRPYPSKPPAIEHPPHFLVKPAADAGVWSIYFNTVLLATLDERD